jgi:hypothetical protein
MKTKTIAYESANGFVKVFYNGLSAVYPNTITQAGLESYAAKQGKGEKPIYTINNRRVIAGETLNYISSSSDSVKRYGTEEYLIESLIALDQFAEDGDSLTVVTGLPSNHYEDKDEAIRLITNNLKKPHTYIVGDTEKTIKIKKVVVTLQPLATFFYTIVDTNGNVDEDMLERYEDTLTLIIDIGWKTTDVAIIRGNSLIKFDTLETSMETTYEAIRTRLKDQAKKEKKKLAGAKNVRLLEIEKQLRKGDAFRWANELNEATLIKREVFTNSAKNIVTEANSFMSFDQVSTIIFTGGGTEALQDYLEPHLINAKTGKHDDNVFLLDDTQLANVKGYYVYETYLQD